MSAIVKENSIYSINDEIKSHPAWKGCISGLTAEKMLRGKESPYLYLLHAGEFQGNNVTDYYVTFIDADLVIRHQPFTITTAVEGWYFEQGTGGGPYAYEAHSIDDVLHLIIHAPEGAPQPFAPSLRDYERN